MSQRTAGLAYSVRLRPTISAGAYTAADQVGGVMTIDLGINNAESQNGKKSKGRQIDDGYVVQSIKIIDEADQKDVLVLSFFNTSPTAAGDGVAVAFSDDDLQDTFLGSVTVAAADYVSYAANAVATVKDVGLLLKTLKKTGQVGTAVGDDRIYMVAHTTGTPTYGATDALGIVIDVMAHI